MGIRIKSQKYDFNRFEILDKHDTLSKLSYRQNKFIHTNFYIYRRLGQEILTTTKSSAKLFVYDNKEYKVAALNHQTFKLLYYLLNQCTNLNLIPSDQNNFN